MCGHSDNRDLGETVGTLRCVGPVGEHNGWYLKGSRLKSQVLSTSFWRGLHFSRCQRAIREFEGYWLSPWRAQRAIFFKGFDVLAPEILIFFCILAGHQHTAAGILALF